MFTGRCSIQHLRLLRCRLVGQQQQQKLPFFRQQQQNPHYLLANGAITATAIFKRSLAVNALEKALERATTDAGHRTHFFQELLQSKVYVVTAQNPEATPGQDEQSSGKGLYLQPWSTASSDGTMGKVFLPFFSSLENFQEAKRIRDDDDSSHHAIIECERFFTLIKEIQTPVVLNPGLSYGKEFMSPEINQLLQEYGGMSSSSSSSSPATATQVESSTLSPETQLYIGPPSEYPTVLIDALKAFFTTQDHNIQAAYLAHVYIPDSGESPHNYIGLQFTDDGGSSSEKESVIQRVIHVQQHAVPEDIVDFIEVSSSGVSDGGIEAYMRKAGPFFSRTQT